MVKFHLCISLFLILWSVSTNGRKAAYLTNFYLLSVPKHLTWLSSISLFPDKRTMDFLCRCDFLNWPPVGVGSYLLLSLHSVAQPSSYFFFCVSMLSCTQCSFSNVGNILKKELFNISLYEDEKKKTLTTTILFLIIIIIIIYYYYRYYCNKR